MAKTSPAQVEMVALHQRAQLLAPGVARQLGQACAEVPQGCSPMDLKKPREIVKIHLRQRAMEFL